MSGDLTGIMINTVDGPIQANENDLRAAGWVPASEVERLRAAVFDYYEATIDHAGNIQLANQDVTRKPLDAAWHRLAAVAEALSEPAAPIVCVMVPAPPPTTNGTLVPCVMATWPRKTHGRRSP